MRTIRGFSVRALEFFDTSYTSFFDVEDGERGHHCLPGHGERRRFGLAPLKNSLGVGSRLYWR